LWNDPGFLSPNRDTPLLGVGALDFAGGVVVHLLGGVAGLSGTIAVGYRNKYTMNPRVQPPRFAYVRGKWTVNELPAASEALAALGVFMLWLGWFGT
jgi:Amt family ammonium transporter